MPVEPTQEMINAINECGRDGYDSIMGDGFSWSLFNAAIQAAPEAPALKPLTVTEDELNEAAISWCDSNGINVFEPEQLASLVSSLWAIMIDAAPALRPLTDEQIHEIYDAVARQEPYMGAVTRRNIVRAIEAAHGIKGDQ